jgi:hypothetical protein
MNWHIHTARTVHCVLAYSHYCLKYRHVFVCTKQRVLSWYVCHWKAKIPLTYFIYVHPVDFWKTIYSTWKHNLNKPGYQLEAVTNTLYMPHINFTKFKKFINTYKHIMFLSRYKISRRKKFYWNVLWVLTEQCVVPSAGRQYDLG